MHAATIRGVGGSMRASAIGMRANDSIVAM
jgi:hypothetical protein